ncbi:MAG: hypothetical protein LUI05_01205 [Oscillospiraceae bacterium]|nr:hypothetical protein [Oscillospiraceae bacterium]
MNMTLKNNFGFYELNDDEMSMVDGGWNGLQWAKGCAMVVVGGVGCAASAIATITNPSVAFVAADAFAASGTMYVEGIKNIYDSF